MRLGALVIEIKWLCLEFFSFALGSVAKNSLDLWYNLIMDKNIGAGESLTPISIACGLTVPQLRVYWLRENL